ncbi:MAG: hypothetical protein ACOVNU_11255 [Candidatus Kapaibacteriota bacterium]|jgi:hypothetical protein
MKKIILVLFVITIFAANQSTLLSKVWQIGVQSEYKFCNEINNLINPNQLINGNCIENVRLTKIKKY